MSITLEDFDKCCRWCLTKAGQMKTLLDSCLDSMFLTIFSLKMIEDQNYPQQVCTRCILKLSTAFNFHQTVTRSRKILMGILEEKLATVTQNTDILDDLKAVQNDETEEQKSVLPDFDSLQTFESNDHDYVLKIDSQVPELMFKTSYTGQDSEDEAFMSEDDEKNLTTNGCKEKKCKHCPFQYKHRNELKEHLQTHKVKCEICLRIMYQHNLEQHYRIHKGDQPKPFCCEICQHRFPTTLALSRHIRACHRAKNNAGYLCSHCGLSFKTFSGFSRHMNVHTGRNLRTCDVCNKKFNTRHYLIEHLKSHGAKPYWCARCEAGFTQLSNLRRHRRLVHAAHSLYRCALCEHVSTSREARAQHKRSVHSQLRCYRCKISFKDHGSLQAHKAVSHSKKKKKARVADLPCDTVPMEKAVTANATLSACLSDGYLVLKVMSESPIE